MDEETPANAEQPLTTDAVFGAPCWVSLLARDLGAAQEFYGRVFGWTFRKGRLGDDFSVAVSAGVPVAGIGALASTLRMAVAWTPYFAVSDVDVTAARIRERSGTVAVGPLSLAGGRGALAADRDGAVFGIWAGSLYAGWDIWHKDAPAWIRLRTRNAFDAAIFYGEVLEWACDRPGCCDVGYEHDEVVLRSGGHLVARLSSGTAESAADPAVRPRWQVYFAVADVETCVRAALAHGGQEVAREATPYGPDVTLRDPDGGLFTVTSDVPRE
ncbi:VOC family protein [Streptomyces sp. NPDC005955]|jgi:predicted enzyme related to lactoylglutathione lyase|uniref:VOC family protein n=1 Tax=Streptomyces sp. NPDC005955 TaxID=3364738 RepID=UPI0036791FE1